MMLASEKVISVTTEKSDRGQSKNYLYQLKKLYLPLKKWLKSDLSTRKGDKNVVSVTAKKILWEDP